MQIYNQCKYAIYVNHPEKKLKENLAGNQEGTVRIEATQIRWFSGQSDRRLDLMRGGQRHSKLS
jgi:hypothetical protein